MKRFTGATCYLQSEYLSPRGSLLQNFKNVLMDLLYALLVDINCIYSPHQPLGYGWTEKSTMPPTMQCFFVKEHTLSGGVRHGGKSEGNTQPPAMAGQHSCTGTRRWGRSNYATSIYSRHLVSHCWY